MVGGDSDVVSQLLSLPVLTTLCVVRGSVWWGDDDDDVVIRFLASNPGIKRLMLVDCDGVRDKVELRLLGRDDMVSTIGAHDIAFLPSLGLLRVCCHLAKYGFPLATLLTRRPRLCVKCDEECWQSNLPLTPAPGKFKAMVEEFVRLA